MSKMQDMIRSVFQGILDLLYPKEVSCLCCDRALGPDAQDGLCSNCVQALDVLEAQQAGKKIAPAPGIAYAYAAYPYTAQARRLVINLKYKHMRDAAVPLARAMAMLPGGEADLLVPVPTTRKRERERGYNQARVLCSLIAKEIGMPMEEALKRTDERTAQVKLSGRSRRENLTGTMEAVERVKGKRVLLIDDVYTTGSTAQEAARALCAAGAVSAGIWTAAKSMYGEEPSLGQLEGDV